ncbi:ShlA/HecA/FhaA protein [Yersinia enterocolitica]|nr:ShlA/HecA/FhaA protein [Yersinia enterocolitica]
MGLSSGGFTGSKDIISNMGGGIPITGGNSGDASSTTHAAVSDGTITIRDTDKQQQNVTDLSRDVEHANNALSPIFDKEKEQNRLREINLIGDIGNQVADIARTQGKIAEEKALKDPKAIQAAKDALAENGNLTPTNKQLVEQIRNTASASYGTGSDLQRAIQAATAITQGLTGGNLGQALAGGSAPYLAHEISKYLPADQSLGANLMAHAVLGAVVGHFNGNATVGAISAFTAEAAAPAIIKAMGWDKDSLTEKQKQTVSALATLAAGLAGGLVGDSSSSAVAGAQAGKNAVENNAVSNWGALIPAATQQDASLAFDIGGKGVTNNEIIKAINNSHIGPSVGDTAKIHGDVKGQVAAGYIAGGYLEGILSEDKFAINGGVTKVIGWRADASAGLTFGPYPIKDFNPAYDYSGAISAGIFSIEGSVGKDGIGGSFRFGGGIGASIRQSENRNNQSELNGSGSTELISWPIKKD